MQKLLGEPELSWVTTVWMSVVTAKLTVFLNLTTSCEKSVSYNVVDLIYKILPVLTLKQASA